MKVREMIEALSRQDPESDVLVRVVWADGEDDDLMFSALAEGGHAYAYDGKSPASFPYRTSPTVVIQSVADGITSATSAGVGDAVATVPQVGARGR